MIQITTQFEIDHRVFAGGDPCAMPAATNLGAPPSLVSAPLG